MRRSRRMTLAISSEPVGLALLYTGADVDTSKCIHLDEYFDFRNHPCLVSELYGMSVFDFLKQNSFQPFPEKHIQDFAKSLLKSVDCKCMDDGLREIC